VLTRAWPIHEAIALYRTVIIDRESIWQSWRLFGSKLVQ
jgi:hypothetical protein